MSDELVGRIGAALAGWFVRPVADRGAQDLRRVAQPVADAPVLLAVADRATLGSAAALALAGTRRGAVVLACWCVPSAQRRSGLAVAGARRLVASLEARGVAASATGRLVLVVLPDDARDAVVVLRRVEGACGDAACVPVLSGPRDEHWDAVLEERGAALLHGAEQAIVELAAARLVEQGVEARVLPAAPGTVARALAVGGWTPPGVHGLRRAAGLA